MKGKVLALTLLGCLLVGGSVTAEAQSTDLSPAWRGEWAYQQTMEDADPAPSDPAFLYGDLLSIYDCKNNHCSFELDYGNQSSICDLSGHVHLKSKNLAYGESNV